MNIKIDNSVDVIDLPAYKVYVAKLIQNGTDNPLVEAVYQNTIGDIVWTRDSIGHYSGTLAGAFTFGKTFIPPFGGDLGLSMPVFYNLPADNFYNIRPHPSNSDSVIISVYDTNGDNVEWSALSLQLIIEIRVYP
jgi:hypothetical protein